MKREERRWRRGEVAASGADAVRQLGPDATASQRLGAAGRAYTSFASGEFVGDCGLTPQQVDGPAASPSRGAAPR